MMPRFMAMMALAFSVSGCATGDDPAVLYTGSIKPVGPPLIADVSPDYAAAYLPPVAGRVEAVRQSSRPDQIDQSILYSNAGYLAGENELTVSIAPASSAKSYTRAPTQREIINEIRTALPGARLQISPSIGRNSIGPFGYASGPAAAGGSCIFAWQNAADISGETRKGKGFGLLTGSRYAARVRLRYCHPEMNEAALVALMSGLRLREISAGTIEMLRFAEGSGVTGRRGYDMSTAEPAKVIKTAGTSAKTGVRRASSEKAPPESAGPVSGTPRVMMPAELAGYSAAQATKPVLVAKSGATTITRSSAPLVPLPAGLGR
ncbi:MULTISPECIES: cellulose biosynthesis protein BcsN [Hoeflea]|uniref:Cellulose biosynthesis protein BcsN n=1 Tax=Hoeflea alexandrii TaxID=288436 RepID=A0ABT1CTT1_9HYPH|nr:MULTISPECIES: cellulose biosynthesis protein BcsN [Hoeflea]MCO6409006.1 cellulose biosynthesis protein BcsN [Hoeflea alexandrii]VVT29997.1 conserved exported hypothetical protein [Hoeflea sp. EC-HK425]